MLPQTSHIALPLCECSAVQGDLWRQSKPGSWREWDVARRLLRLNCSEDLVKCPYVGFDLFFVEATIGLRVIHSLFCGISGRGSAYTD